MTKDLLQQWWEETYPDAGVKNVYELSDGIVTKDMLYHFSLWVSQKIINLIYKKS